MNRIWEGRARRLGDDIDTDSIIASSRKRETLDPHELKRWLLESIDREFANSVVAGDILVAGEAFGSGSAMEVAVTVVLAAGIRVVIARSFSRTYFRNAVNNGLVPIECDTRGIAEGDRLRVVLEPGACLVVNVTTGATIPAPVIPPFALGILAAGGLVPFVVRHGSLQPGGAA